MSKPYVLIRKKLSNGKRFLCWGVYPTKAAAKRAASKLNGLYGCEYKYSVIKAVKQVEFSNA